MIVVLSWAMMLNIAKLIRDRMVMQNEADNAVLNLATHKARTMNFVASMNYLIGTVLSLGMEPNWVQIPYYSTEKVGSYVYGDLGNGFDQKKGDGAGMLKDIVNGLQKAQDVALYNEEAYNLFVWIELAEKGYYMDPLGIPTDMEKYLGIKRNTKGITYIYTYSTTVKGIRIVYNPLPNFGQYEMDEMSGESNSQGDWGTVKKILSPITTVGKLIGRGSTVEYKHDDYSWYVADKDNISNQKIRMTIIKLASDSDRPLFAKLLGISYPIMVANSAAAIYNTKGTMFPSKEGTNTGVTDAPLFYLNTGAESAQVAMLTAKLINVFEKPGAIASLAIGGYVTARTALNWARAYYDKDNPIDAYDAAKKGGWAAHLVPYDVEKQ